MLKKHKYLFLLLFTLTTLQASLGSELSKQEESNLLYGYWKMPSQFSLQRIEKLITLLSNQTHNIGFRYIGVEEDLFHGHVLFERVGSGDEAKLYPRAILYHTQEEAHKAHWEKSIDNKYDYLNVATRNWIQWLSDDEEKDGDKIENAKIYVDAAKRDPKQFEQDFAAPDIKLHYTIHASNLDNKKLGFILAGELQFEFHLKKTETTVTEYSTLGDKGPISITLPNGETSDLILTTHTMYIERQSP